MLAMMGMILVGGANGEMITGAIMSAQAMAQQAQINFTRHNEIEADRVGIRTLAASGYDPQGMADFFSKMGQTSRVNGEGPPEFLRTHPMSVNRVAEAESRIHSLPPVEPDEGRQFYIVQGRLRALIETDAEKTILYFETELEKEISDAQRNGHLYGMAITLQKNAEFDRAELILSELLEKEPSRLAFQLQMADLQLAQGNQEQAVSALSDLNLMFPGNKAIAMGYARALIEGKNAEQAAIAVNALKVQLKRQKDDPALYALYAQASSLAGDETRATEAIAESYYQRGGLEEAITQLEHLSNSNDLDYYQRARVSARLMELRIEAGESDPEETKT